MDEILFVIDNIGISDGVNVWNLGGSRIST